MIRDIQLEALSVKDSQSQRKVEKDEKCYNVCYSKTKNIWAVNQSKDPKSFNGTNLT